MRPKLAMLTGLTTCCLWAPAALDISAAQGYEHFIVGNAADVVTSTDRLAVCAPKTPLTFRNISVYRIGPGATFDLDQWAGTGGLAYTLSAEAGVLISSRGEIY